tara:strand:+ start:77 stop:913 length:837 start_codon:yes stop_codon:yes gene_type:complete
MGNLNENMGGKIEIEFQDWLDEMNDKDYPERLTLETVIEYSQNTLRGGKNKGGKIEIEFQDWLDMMYKDYPKIETLETVIEYSQDTLRDYDLDDWVPQGQSTSESKKIKKMENLNEGKNKKGKMTYEAALREIDAQSAIVAMEAKIEKLKEMATKKKEKMKMVQEDENLSELIDKRAMNEMMKEIKQIEKMQEKLEKLYEKKNGKKMPKMVDEVEELEEETVEEGGYGSNYEEDGMKEEVVAEEELDEAHCSEEDDDNPSMEEEINEEVSRWQKLAGL